MARLRHCRLYDVQTVCSSRLLPGSVVTACFLVGREKAVSNFGYRVNLREERNCLIIILS